jgi:hypothetical protein
MSPHALKNMTKEERINLIRFGPDKNKKPKKIAVDLLQKYKPMINLNKYKVIANDLEKEAKSNSKHILEDKQNAAISLLSEKEQAKIFKKRRMKASFIAKKKETINSEERKEEGNSS